MGHVADLATSVLNGKGWQLGLYLSGVDVYTSILAGELVGGSYARIDAPTWVVDTDTAFESKVHPDLTDLVWYSLPVSSVGGIFVAKAGDTGCLSAWQFSVPVAVTNNAMLRYPAADLVLTFVTDVL